MILAKLKEATKFQHQQLEQTVDLMNRARDLAAYEKLLRLFYGFYAPVESNIRQTLTRQNVVFYESRLKTPLLVRDFKKLNGENFQFDPLETCGDTPVFDNFAQTIGGLYVLEGATLGGQIIGRHLRQHLDLTPENGAAFFSSYGERVGQMWKEFCSFATTQAEILQSDDEILNAAIETFTKFDEWLSVRVPN